jgi:hypothetical protein
MFDSGLRPRFVALVLLLTFGLFVAADAAGDGERHLMGIFRKLAVTETGPPSPKTERSLASLAGIEPSRGRGRS